MNKPPPALDRLSPEWPENLLPRIRERGSTANQTIVVLDDDPTGTQIVYDTPVLTRWSVDLLAAEFSRAEPLVYILTNSRSVTGEEAARLNREVAAALVEARSRTDRDYTVISRSDSTLRGHFPLETDVLAEALGETEAVCLVVPFFLEGGRLTVDDVHYVVENGIWTPAAETPFARDAVFGFRASNLRQWVEEKTDGRVPADAVHSLALSTIRQGPEAALQALLAIPEGGVGVVNALSMRDIEVVVAAILEAEAQGKRFLYRTAASFVRARAGLEKRPLLEASDLISSQTTQAPGGLVVVGSHVPKTTRNLERLLDQPGIVPIEIRVPDILADSPAAPPIKKLQQHLAAGEPCVVFTSRDVVTGGSESDNLRIGQTVSRHLVDLVGGLTEAPRFLIAKGGITSSDLATKALGVERAVVRGQILPGVPVWELGDGSRFPGLPYVVFPGNVGGDEALLEAFQGLHPAQPTQDS